MVSRLVAIIFIYICTAVAWFVLGGTVMMRSETQDGKLRGQVGKLWGTPHRQEAPQAWYETKRDIEQKNVEAGKTNVTIRTETRTHAVLLENSRVNVNLALEHRRKGLLWYSTYKVKFAGQYTITNSTAEARQVFVKFHFPAEGAVYDNFKLIVAGKEIADVVVNEGSVKQSVMVPAGETRAVEVAYDSQGLDEWWYAFGDEVSQVKDFTLTMNTDFAKIDFPQDSISPTGKTATGTGWKLEWKYTNLLTGVKIGMQMPKKLNPGPWVSQVTFFGPVSLLLFFFLMYMFTTLRGINVHPMNYFFLGAGFFSFHLLMAYLVDHVDIHAAFAIAAATSVFLVVTYMRLVVGARLALVETALSQLVYLVLFSYAFFFEGYTGLSITVLCIVTLFIVMQFTGRVDWSAIFRKPGATAPPVLR
jgi:inner membrane protein involved in colicin E2 resistance